MAESEIKNKTQKRKIAGDLDFVSTEAYNYLRTNLSFSFPGKTMGRTIGVTSSNPQEGKSFTSINLSYSIAKDGHSVLLISADLRLPSIEKALNLPLGKGLSNLLADNVSLEETKGIIKKGILHENMSLLMAGDIPPNPSELLGSERMGELIEGFKQYYEYVIIDLPPVNAVIDPVVASKFTDGMVVIIRHGHTKKQNLSSAISQLRLSGVRILGFVYNDYKTNSHGYYRKGYYKKNNYYYKGRNYYTAASKEETK